MPVARRITPEDLAVVAAHIGAGGSVRSAARVIGCAVSSLQKRIGNDPSLRAAIDRETREARRRERTALQREAARIRRANGITAPEHQGAHVDAREAAEERRRNGLAAGMADTRIGPSTGSATGGASGRRASGKPTGTSRVRLLLSGTGHLGSSHEDFCAHLDAHDRDRRDPPVELRLRDPDGIELAYRCVRASEAQPLIDAGYEVLP